MVTDDCTWISPIAFAWGAENLSPVKKYLKQLDLPIFSITKGEITAGIKPSFTSVNPNLAES